MDKVCFDFDGTLDKKGVQDYAVSLIHRGIDIWICTSRKSPENAPIGWNDDLFLVSDNLGIDRSKIIFTNTDNKWSYIKDKGFIWHLYDFFTDINLINQHTNIKGICVFGNSNWKHKCNKLLTKL
jgi:hypothetical protein